MKLYPKIEVQTLRHPSDVFRLSYTLYLRLRVWQSIVYYIGEERMYNGRELCALVWRLGIFLSDVSDSSAGGLRLSTSSKIRAPWNNGQ